jgi:hypothetical protein
VRHALTRCGIAAAVLGASLAAAAQPNCPRGEAIQWIADWCMAKIETDDEIAASGCIAREQRRKFANACRAKTHYKRALCRIAIANRVRTDSAAQCTADPAFAGATVRDGGAGR